MSLKEDLTGEVEKHSEKIDAAQKKPTGPTQSYTSIGDLTTLRPDQLAMAKGSKEPKANRGALPHGGKPMDEWTTAGRHHQDPITTVVASEFKKQRG